jgi:hypothetical protein
VGEPAFGFRLRHVPILMAVVAIFVCGFSFLKSFGEAHQAAVGAAFRDGYMPREQVRYDVGPEADQWPESDARK